MEKCESKCFLVFLFISLFDRDQVVRSGLDQVDLFPGKDFIVGSSQRLLHHSEGICKEVMGARQHNSLTLS